MMPPIDEESEAIINTPEFQRLSMMHSKFVIEYCGLFSAEGTWNASEAARRAGYSPASAPVTSCRILQRDDVRAAINRYLTKRQEQWGEVLHAVVAELAMIGFADVTDVVEIENGCLIVNDTDSLPQATRRAISEISENITKDGSTLKVKMHSKIDALRLLAKITGGLVDRHAGADGKSPIQVEGGLSREGANQLLSALGMPEVEE